MKWKQNHHIKLAYTIDTIFYPRETLHRRKPKQPFVISIDSIKQVQHDYEHHQTLITRVYIEWDPKVLIFSM